MSTVADQTSNSKSYGYAGKILTSTNFKFAFLNLQFKVLLSLW